MALINHGVTITVIEEFSALYQRTIPMSIITITQKLIEIRNVISDKLFDDPEDNYYRAKRERFDYVEDVIRFSLSAQTIGLMAQIVDYETSEHDVKLPEGEYFETWTKVTGDIARGLERFEKNLGYSDEMDFINEEYHKALNALIYFIYEKHETRECAFNRLFTDWDNSVIAAEQFFKEQKIKAGGVPASMH